MLCRTCENLSIPIPSAGEYTDAIPLFSSIRKLRDSAAVCELCSLFADALSTVRLKGIKNGQVRLVSWASDAQGDPLGMSRVYVQVGEGIGRWVDVFAEPRSVAAETGVAVGESFLHHPSSGASFAKYKQWLRECTTSHISCPRSESAGLPSRVLQVLEENGTECLRLFATAGRKGRYVALSHCWGLYRGLTTTTASLQAHMRGISPLSLSKTVSDAIQITRGMSIQFLWVDTLCIIQDNMEDWQSEALKMDEVYRLAQFTIAASGAGDGRAGCFFDRDTHATPVSVPISFPQSKERAHIHFKKHSGSISEGFTDSPLNKRGWCLQEMVLSSRIIHFGKERVIWQCRERLTADDYHMLRQQRVSTNDRRVIEPHLDFSLSPGISSWFNIVEEYSRRLLTRHEDKAYAIQGIKNLFARSINSPYSAGIWRSAIHKGLMWYPASGQMEVVPLKRAGSWSWLALDGPIEHIHIHQSASYRSDPILLVVDFPSDLSVVHRATPKHSITVSSLAVPVTRSDRTISVEEFPELSSEANRTLLLDKAELQCHAILNDQGDPIGWATFDLPSFVEEPLLCLVISILKRHSAFQSYQVLILGYSQSEPTVLCRLGIGEVVEEGFLVNERHCEIVIV